MEPPLRGDYKNGENNNIKKNEEIKVEYSSLPPKLTVIELNLNNENVRYRIRRQVFNRYKNNVPSIKKKENESNKCQDEKSKKLDRFTSQSASNFGITYINSRRSSLSQGKERILRFKGNQLDNSPDEINPEPKKQKEIKKKNALFENSKAFSLLIQTIDAKKCDQNARANNPHKILFQRQKSNPRFIKLNIERNTEKIGDLESENEKQKYNTERMYMKSAPRIRCTTKNKQNEPLEALKLKQLNLTLKQRNEETMKHTQKQGEKFTTFTTLSLFSSAHPTTAHTLSHTTDAPNLTNSNITTTTTQRQRQRKQRESLNRTNQTSPILKHSDDTNIITHASGRKTTNMYKSYSERKIHTPRTNTQFQNSKKLNYMQIGKSMDSGCSGKKYVEKGKRGNKSQRDFEIQKDYDAVQAFKARIEKEKEKDKREDGNERRGKHSLNREECTCEEDKWNDLEKQKINNIMTIRPIQSTLQSDQWKTRFISNLIKSKQIQSFSNLKHFYKLNNYVYSQKQTHAQALAANQIANIPKKEIDNKFFLLKFPINKRWTPNSQLIIQDLSDSAYPSVVFKALKPHHSYLILGKNNSHIYNPLNDFTWCKDPASLKGHTIRIQTQNITKYLHFDYFNIKSYTLAFYDISHYHKHQAHKSGTYGREMTFGYEPSAIQKCGSLKIKKNIVIEFKDCIIVAQSLNAFKILMENNTNFNKVFA